MLELPAPPRGRRLAILAVMALTAASALALLASVRGEIAYFFASDRAADLGEAPGLGLEGLESNQYARVRGSPMASRTVRYSTLLTGQQYALFPLAGQRDLFVRVAVEPGWRREAPTRFSGRLVRFGELGVRFGAVAEYLEGDLGMTVGPGTYVLLSDKPPGSYAWALGIALLCMLIVGLDVWLLLRWFRPLATEDRSEADQPANSAK
jgi:hypothetical protein